MPTTPTALYEAALDAVTARGIADPTDLAALLQRLFFDAHAAGRRDVSWAAMDGTARALGCRDLLGTLRECLVHEQLPMLRLLQAEPLRMQCSHLAFQEFYTAREIATNGTALPGLPPWQWWALWDNTISLGEAMGEQFRRGLLRASGIEGDALRLQGEVGSYGMDWELLPDGSGAGAGAAAARWPELAAAIGRGKMEFGREE